MEDQLSCELLLLQGLRVTINPITMKRTTSLITCLLFLSYIANGQCLTPPTFPECTGNESLVVANDNILISQTKYFYGSAASLANVKLSGGTLVVCGDLTLTEFVFDSGAIFIQPAATLTVSNGAGLIVRGNTAIYNAGIFQCLGNYVMDGSYASPAKPNIFINTSLSSWLKMQNQYFVINNPNSKLINAGIADFHGLITDPQAAAGSVCLGFKSQTRMTVLYNRAKNPYIALSGPACVTVSQYSQFYDTLTVFPDVHFCLASTHVSDASCIPWGCKPNAWGGEVTKNCSNCATVLTFLSMAFKKTEAIAHANFNEIQWRMSSGGKQLFYILRSTDGLNFVIADSIKGDNKTDYSFKDYLFNTNNFYKIICSTGNRQISSDVVQVKRVLLNEIYPNPFRNYLIIPFKTSEIKTASVRITDVYGREVHSYKLVMDNERAALYFENMPRGVYLVNITNKQQSHIYKVIKE